LAFAGAFGAAVFLAVTFALAVGFAALAGGGVFPLTPFGAAGFAVAAVAAFFALAAAAFPFTMGFSRQQMISPIAHPHTSSTTTTSPHTLHVNKSPFLNSAMRVSLLKKFSP
jgi:hypothetical protein